FVPRIRKNEKIRAREIRVIGPDSKQIGIMAPADALELAKRAGLDLVEISASAKPPVCRILDFGKYQYELAKKEKDSKHKKTSSGKVKEVKFRVRIEQHDFMYKIKHAEEFLGKGFKVKLTLMFRGREMEHTDLGFEIIARAVKELDHIGHPDSEARLAGRVINTMMSPVPVKDRVFKYNLPDEVEEEED
ncbi:MAG: translation initiation factor IF-3, partial [Verrucomicrobiae bacterium]|nr:translation initiation factor IF-3 [Verrucomicrobiae bacterium]